MTADALREICAGCGDDCPEEPVISHDVAFCCEDCVPVVWLLADDKAAKQEREVRS